MIFVAQGVARTVGALVLLCAAVTHSFAGTTLDRIKQDGIVHVGYDDGLPFSYKTAKDASPAGYSIDICLALVESLRHEYKLKSLDVRFVPVTSDNHVAQIVDGKVDLVCAGVTNTKERREKVAFSLPMYYASAKLLVREGSGIKRVDDLDGKTLAVLKGTTGERIAETRRSGMPGLKLLRVESDEDGLKAVASQAADAYIDDDIALYGLKAKSSERLAVVGSALSIEPLALMFSKIDRELGNFVHREMGQLYKTGQIRKLYSKWFQSPLPQLSFNLNVVPNQLTADMFNNPSAYATDWTVF